VIIISTVGPDIAVGLTTFHERVPPL